MYSERSSFTIFGFRTLLLGEKLIPPKTLYVGAPEPRIIPAVPPAVASKPVLPIFHLTPPLNSAGDSTLFSKGSVNLVVAATSATTDTGSMIFIEVAKLRLSCLLFLHF